VRRRAILAARNRNPVLLGDIGGTNLRFALCDRGIVGPVKSSPTASYKNLLVAIGTYLAAEPHGEASASCAARCRVAGERRRECHYHNP